jgi:hypothetical protein
VTIRHGNLATRRRILQAGFGAVTGGISVRADAQEKIAQSVVQYQPQPKNGLFCSTCVNFDPPGSCKIVAGAISPNGWCLVYAPKT